MIFILTLKRKDNFELKTHKKYNRGLKAVVFFIIYIISKNYRIISISDGVDIFIFVCSPHLSARTFIFPYGVG